MKKEKKSYDEILNFMKAVYFEKFQENLQISAIHVDCVVYTLFVQSSEILPQKYCSKVDALFYTDPVLLHLWRIITGAIYLNLSNHDFLDMLKSFLLDETENIPKEKKRISNISKISK